jgi:hypothetical protein
VSRWDELSDGARQMLTDFDELDLAEIAAGATEVMAKVKAVRDLHRPAEYRGRIICAECSAWDGESTDNPPVDHDQCGTLRVLDGKGKP